MSKRKESLDVVVAKAIRKAMREGQPRRVRVKSAEQLQYEQMLADYQANGAAHLASAKAKMGK